jgi:hypothetical protein
MRVFVAVQPTPKGRVSSLSRYIADSKVERERERVDERGSRPLFSAREDNLTFSQADEILNPTNRELEKKDVIHVVVSPEPGSIERAGDDDDERRATFIEAIRDAIHEMEVELNVRSLSWIAGLHDNTRTPHAHIAVSRWAIDATTGKLKYIRHLPASLLPRNIEGENGRKRFSRGKIAEVFAHSMDSKLKPIRFVRLTDKKRNTEITRCVLTRFDEMLREPTSEERVVGRWLETELMLSQGQYGEMSRDDLIRENEALTNQVVNIDAQPRAQGARPPAAYIPPQRLEDLLRTKSSDVTITVSTERVLPENEKHLDKAQLPQQESHQAVEPSNNGQNEILKSSSVLNQQPERESQLRESNDKIQAANKEQGRADRNRTSQVMAHRESVPTKSKGFEAQATNEPPRVATRTFQQLQHEIRQNPDSIHLFRGIESTTSQIHPHATISASAPSNAGNGHDSSSLQTNNLLVRSDSLPVVETEQVRITGGISTDSSRVSVPVPQPEISNQTLAWIAGVTQFTLALMRPENTDNEKSGSPARDYDAQMTANRNEPWNSRLREAELLDEIYDRACKQRGVTPNTNGVQDFVSERYKSAYGRLSPLGFLWSELNSARQHLESVRQFANQNALDEYHRLHEHNPWLNPDPGELREELALTDHTLGGADREQELEQPMETEAQEHTQEVGEMIL